MNNEQIIKRIKELEERARKNREKYDTLPLSAYLDLDDEKEYNRLIKKIRSTKKWWQEKIL